VIGIEDYQELVDGSAITVPQYAFSFVDFGWGWRITASTRMWRC
jgi:hypothetical protein